MRSSAPSALSLAIVVILVLSSGGCGQPAGTSSSGTSAPFVPPASTTTTTTAVSTTAPYATTTSATAPSGSSEPSAPAVSIPEGGLEYTRLPGDEQVVALTFDGAYESAPLADILAALDAHDAPATFFVTGEFVEDFPAAIEAIVASGRPIGSHSYSHPDFTTLSDGEIDKQLERTAALLVEAGADDPRPLFRFPYGARDAHVLSVVGEAGYVSVYWTIDTLDWKPERTPEAIRDDVLKRVSSGAVILMHIGSEQTASILSVLLDDLSDAGYGFVDARSVLGGPSG